MISLIVAATKNNAIGKDNKLLFHIKEDLRFFKETTINKTIIMGRKTFEAPPITKISSFEYLTSSNTSSNECLISTCELYIFP